MKLLKDAICERTDPPLQNMLRAMRAASFVPENILPVLTLLGCEAQSYAIDDVPYWKITRGLFYVRIREESIGSDEAKWRELIGVLLDYVNSKKDHA